MQSRRSPAKSHRAAGRAVDPTRRDRGQRRGSPLRRVTPRRAGAVGSPGPRRAGGRGRRRKPSPDGWGPRYSEMSPVAGPPAPWTSEPRRYAASSPVPLPVSPRADVSPTPLPPSDLAPAPYSLHAVSSRRGLLTPQPAAALAPAPAPPDGAAPCHAAIFLHSAAAVGGAAGAVAELESETRARIEELAAWTLKGAAAAARESLRLFRLLQADVARAAAAVDALAAERQAARTRSFDRWVPSAPPSAPTPAVRLSSSSAAAAPALLLLDAIPVTPQPAAQQRTRTPVSAVVDPPPHPRATEAAPRSPPPHPSATEAAPRSPPAPATRSPPPPARESSPPPPRAKRFSVDDAWAAPPKVELLQQLRETAEAEASESRRGARLREELERVRGRAASPSECGSPELPRPLAQVPVFPADGGCE